MLELFTCGIFAELVRCLDKNAGFYYIKEHYYDWFPALPSYEVYNRKLNKYHEALVYTFKVLRKNDDANQGLAMIDTSPIEVCQAQHSYQLKAAQSFVSKNYKGSFVELAGFEPATSWLPAEKL